MKDVNAQSLLASVMDWSDPEVIVSNGSILQLLSDYKYDQYQQFGPGRRFIESLALWLRQFEPADREMAFSLVRDRLIFISEQEMEHLVQLAYPDVIVPERMRIVAEENDIAIHKVGKLTGHPRFEQLRKKSLYLGLSDGAHTNDLRRASNGAISNEQIWQAYELGEAKAEDMLEELRASLNDEHEGGVSQSGEQAGSDDRFNIVWLVDDFSGSGNTYIRFDAIEQKYKGKIKKIYEMIYDGDLIDLDYYEINLLLYVCTRQAIDHIEYWSERYATEFGFKPLKLHVLFPIEKYVSLNASSDAEILKMLGKAKYYDPRASDKHIEVGGTKSAQFGFANCSLPLVLSHNTPNNSVYALWGPEEFKFFGLFPRVSRHREI